MPSTATSFIMAASSGLARSDRLAFFPPTNPAYVDLTDTYPHDVERARELLAEAGFEYGFSATPAPPTPNLCP